MTANRLKNCNKTRQRGTAEASWFKGTGEIWLQLMRAKGRQETEWWSPNTAVSSGPLAGGGATDEWDTSSLTAAPQTVMERHNITTTDGEIDGHARQHEKDKRNLERRIALIYETARDGGLRGLSSYDSHCKTKRSDSHPSQKQTVLGWSNTVTGA